MSHTVVHRKSTFKTITTKKEPLGPVLKFKWSLSAAHLALMEDKSTSIFPTIGPTRTQRKISPTRSSLIIDSSSTSHYSTSTNKTSLLPSIMKQPKSSKSNNEDEKSVQTLPLMLTFTQLQYPSSPSILNRRKKSRLSICPISDDSKENFSLLNNKLLSTARSSLTSTATLSLLSMKIDNRSNNEDCVRLNSPQLRRLNVSEKYINEAKKLYYNPEWKVFTPRALVT